MDCTIAMPTKSGGMIPTQSTTKDYVLNTPYAYAAGHASFYDIIPTGNLDTCHINNCYLREVGCSPSSTFSGAAVIDTDYYRHSPPITT